MKLLLIGIVSLSLWLDSAATQASQEPAMRDASAQRIETYAAAEIDASGSLRITTSDGKTIVVPKDREQSAFRPPAISPDRTAVGAQADYPNCCTSYDIPLQLVVFSNGKVHWFKGVGLPNG